MYSESIRNVSHQYWSYCSVQRQIESSILPSLRNMHSFKIWLKSCKSWREGGRRMHLCPPTKTFYYQSSWLKPAHLPFAQPFAKDNRGDFVETFWTMFWKTFWAIFQNCWHKVMGNFQQLKSGGVSRQDKRPDFSAEKGWFAYIKIKARKGQQTSPKTQIQILEVLFGRELNSNQNAFTRCIMNLKLLSYRS